MTMFNDVTFAQTGRKFWNAISLRKPSTKKQISIDDVLEYLQSKPQHSFDLYFTEYANHDEKSKSENKLCKSDLKPEDTYLELKTILNRHQPLCEKAEEENYVSRFDNTGRTYIDISGINGLDSSKDVSYTCRIGCNIPKLAISKNISSKIDVSNDHFMIKGRLKYIYKDHDSKAVASTSQILKYRFQEKKDHISSIEFGRILSSDLKPELWFNDFWTGESALYMLEEGKAVMYLTDSEHNLIYKNLDDAVKQLRRKDNYFPKDSDIKEVISAKSTFRLELDDLNFRENNYDGERAVLEIGTATYNAYYAEPASPLTPKPMNESETTLINRILGTGKTFDKIMSKLNKYGYGYVDIDILNPDYIKKTLTKNNAKALVRPCSVQRMDRGSYYSRAMDTFHINNHYRDVDKEQAICIKYDKKGE